jgi:hypothetical protein
LDSRRSVVPLASRVGGKPWEKSPNSGDRYGSCRLRALGKLPGAEDHRAAVQIDVNPLIVVVHAGRRYREHVDADVHLRDIDPGNLRSATRRSQPIADLPIDRSDQRSPTIDIIQRRIGRQRDLSRGQMLLSRHAH